MCSPVKMHGPQIWPVSWSFLACVSFKFTLKCNILFHPTRWMFSVNFMKFEWNLGDTALRSMTDRWAGGDRHGVLTELLAAPPPKYISLSQTHAHTQHIHVCCWYRCSGTGKWFSNRKETNCLPLMNAEPRGYLEPNLQQTECLLTNRLSYRGSSLKLELDSPSLSEHSAHSIPLLFGISTWLWWYTCLLLLILMLWHRQAIF